MSSLIKKLGIQDEKYPFLLKEIPGAPQELYYLGTLPTSQEIAVSIVGTRKATHEGLLSAKQIGHDLAKSGITVVSGLALGIDGAAHEGALAGGGKTIAVLANGLDIIYPQRHYQLAKKILDLKGCIISERPENAPYYPNQFLERNRIISGLSIALVVIEAPIHSGSLVTAKHALDQGREVFVVPGNVGHQNHRGSHMLLRNGARLVTNAEDILEDLDHAISTLIPSPKPRDNFQLPTRLPDGQVSKPAPTKTKIDDEVQLSILKIVQNATKPIDVDKIIEATKLQPQTVNQKLTFLTLEGFIEEKNGKFKVSSKISR